MIGHVGVGGVDANALGDDFGQWPAGANQVIVDVAGAFLVAHQAAVLQLVVEAAEFSAAIRLRGDVAYPFWFPPTDRRLPPILRLTCWWRQPSCGFRGEIGMNKTQSGAGWTVSIVAGTGEPGYSGDGSSALEARLNNPFDLAFSPDGSLVFSDTFNHCIRRIDAASGVISTICGMGAKGFSGDGGPAVRAQLNEPMAWSIERSGRVFFADRLNRRVRVIDTTGIVSTLAGDGSGEYSGDGGPAARAGLVEPNGLALSPDQSRLFIADVAGHRVRVVDLASRHDRNLRWDRRGSAPRRWRPWLRRPRCSAPAR